jgi:hypothetical protein
MRALGSGGGQRAQKLLGLGVVTGRLAAVGVVELVARADDKDTAELPRVPLDSTLSESATVGLEALCEDGEAEASHAAPSELSCPVPAEAGVDVQWERKVEFLSEVSCLRRRAVPDHVELGSSAADLFPDAAQLRDLLAAEDSAEVTNEDQDGGTLPPELLQTPRLSIEVLDLDPGEIFNESHEGSP